MKVRLTVERGDYNSQITVGNESFVVECYLADISQVPPVPTPHNPNVVDTSDANATADKIFKGFSAYAQGQKIDGEFEQNNPNIINTGTGDITPDDVVLGKTGFAKGQEVTGALDVANMVADAYDCGIADILAEQADGDITPDDVRAGKTGFAAGNTKIVGTHSDKIIEPVKNITIATNGLTEVTPNEGFDAIEKVNITTDIPMPNIITRYYPSKFTGNGDFLITPHGYDAMQHCWIRVDVPPPATETEKSISIIENGETIVTPTEGFVSISKLKIITNVPNPYDAEYRKDPLWWDIYSILANDETPGYIAKMAVLICDEWLYSEMSGADAYRTSDGAFYEVENKNTLIRHNWQPSSYREDSKGYKTKHVIRYYKTNAIINPSFGNVTNNSLGCWPIGIACRDASISASAFLQNNYSLQFYNHINCIYTGTSLNAFLGAGNNYCLQQIPDSFEFASNILTFGSAFQSRSLKTLNVSSIDFTGLNPVSFSGFFANMYLLEKVIGTIDCSKATAIGSWFAQSYMLKEFTLRNVRQSLTFVSAVIEYETLRDLIVNGLLPATGQTLKLAGSYYALTDELKAIAAAKGWTVTT